MGRWGQVSFDLEMRVLRVRSIHSFVRLFIHSFSHLMFTEHLPRAMPTRAEGLEGRIVLGSWWMGLWGGLPKARLSCPTVCNQSHLLGREGHT